MWFADVFLCASLCCHIGTLRCVMPDRFATTPIEPVAVEGIHGMHAAFLEQIRARVPQASRPRKEVVMGLAERRKTLGYSQEKLAGLLGVDRTTVGRWESGRIEPQPPQRRGLASALEVSLQELDVLLAELRAAGQEATGRQSSDHSSAGAPDEMIRREFLRILTVSGALTALPVDEAEALTDGVLRGCLPTSSG